MHKLYTNKYVSLILANNYNLTIIWLNGAVGHAKGLIDSLSSFGCKLILRRDTIGNNACFLTL